MTAKRKATLHSQVEARLRAAMTSGVYAPGAWLPDERQLAQELGVSRSTVRLALQALEREQLIVRTQGRGTRVAAAPGAARYLCVLASGVTARFQHYESLVIAQLEQSAAEAGYHLAVRYVTDPNLLPEVMRELEQDASVAGGVLVGRAESSQVAAVGRASRIPWVRIGDFFDVERPAPVLDQVVGDNYRLAELATRQLVAQGGRRFALFLHDDCMIWSREAMDAFRSVLDAAGIPTADQQIVDLMPTHRDATSADANRRRNVENALAAIRLWEAAGRWPDGVVLTLGCGRILDDCLWSLPEAATKLRALRLSFMDLEEYYQAAAPHPAAGQCCSWALLSIAAMTRQAVAFLSEGASPARAPRRAYVREVRGVAAAATTAVLNAV